MPQKVLALLGVWLWFLQWHCLKTYVSRMFKQLGQRTSWQQRLALLFVDRRGFIHIGRQYFRPPNVNEWLLLWPKKVLTLLTNDILTLTYSSWLKNNDWSSFAGREPQTPTPILTCTQTQHSVSSNPMIYLMRLFFSVPTRAVSLDNVTLSVDLCPHIVRIAFTHLGPAGQQRKC